MSAIDPDTPDKPIEVATSPASEQAGSAGRDIILIVSVLPALLAVLGKHDLNAVINYISGVEFAPVLSVLVGAGVVAWRQWVTRRSHANKLMMARNVSNRIAIEK